MRYIQHYHMYERKDKSKFITNITRKLGIILIIPLKRFVKRKTKTMKIETHDKTTDEN